MLDALAAVLLDEFLDLVQLSAVRRIFRLVDRNADLAARRRQRAARQSRVFPADIEVLMLAEVEYAVVEIEKMIHSSLRDVVGQMVQFDETGAGRERVDTRELHEVDVINRRVRISIDQVDETSADALNRRNIELHRSHGAFDLARTGGNRIAQRAGGILDAKGHGAGTGPMVPRELLRKAIRLGVDDEIDIALAVERHVFGAVPGDTRKAHGFEQT